MTDSVLIDHEWTQVDPLGEALHFLHMDGVFYSRSEMTAPWGMDLPAMPDFLMFHVVTSGRCLLQVEGAKPRWIQPGDFVLVPHGDGHQLLSDPDAEATDLFDIPRVQMTERYEFMRFGNGGEPTNLICGAVRFEDPAAHHLTKLLPRVIFIEAWRSPHMEWIQSTLRLMASEAKELKPGGETIITRLADILIVQAIRSWMAEDPTAKTGWLGALQDDQIGRAILLIQRDPAQAWTVASLATAVSMSRSAFAARFMELVGQSPMQYVTQWKMNTALNWIKAGKVKISELHSQLGYQSQAAFSRAFKRFFGYPPGAARQHSLEGVE